MAEYQDALLNSARLILENLSGRPGTSGSSGFSGISGLSGAAGTAAAKGDSGFSGQSGISGNSGTSGYSGRSGISGERGDAGVQGTSGTSGKSGWSGYSGASGAKGSGFVGTSTTSFNLDVNGFPYTFTVSTDLAYRAGDVVRFIDLGTNNWFSTLITSYNASNGQMVVNTLQGRSTGSSISSANWSISLTGYSGASGSGGGGGGDSYWDRNATSGFTYLLNNNDKVGLGTNHPLNDLSFSNSSDKTIGVQPSVNDDVGRNLTIMAGNVGPTASDLNGGNLYFSTGVSRGNNFNEIGFYTYLNNDTSDAVGTQFLGARISNSIFQTMLPFVVHKNANTFPSIFLTADTIYQATGTAQHLIKVNDSITGYPAMPLTIHAGNVTGSPNSNGGNLILEAGFPTGLGTASILFKTAKGTTSNSTQVTATTKMELGGDGKLTLYENGLATLGSIQLKTDVSRFNHYINFGNTSGNAGYGIRDNSGVIEIKNNGGSWTGLQGYSGTSGATGSSGASGISGLNGTNGTNGTSGYSGVAGLGYKTTSTTNLTISNPLGVSFVTFTTVDSNLAYRPGDRLKITDVGSGNYFEGRVKSFSGTSLQIDLNYYSTVSPITSSSWSIGLVGEKGQSGYSGSPGSSGYSGIKGDIGPAGGSPLGFMSFTFTEDDTYDLIVPTYPVQYNATSLTVLGVTKNGNYGTVKLYKNTVEQTSFPFTVDSSDTLTIEATSVTDKLIVSVAIKDPDGAKLAQIVNVAKSGGDYSNIQSAITSITDASATKPYVVKIAPGLYDLGSGTITGKQYVSIVGSGIDNTIIKSTNTTVMTLLSNSYLSDVQLWQNIITEGTSRQALDLASNSNISVFRNKFIGPNASINTINVNNINISQNIFASPSGIRTVAFDKLHVFDNIHEYYGDGYDGYIGFMSVGGDNGSTVCKNAIVKNNVSSVLRNAGTNNSYVCIHLVIGSNLLIEDNLFNVSLLGGTIVSTGCGIRLSGTDQLIDAFAPSIIRNNTFIMRVNSPTQNISLTGALVEGNTVGDPSSFYIENNRFLFTFDDQGHIQDKIYASEGINVYLTDNAFLGLESYPVTFYSPANINYVQTVPRINTKTGANVNASTLASVFGSSSVVGEGFLSFYKASTNRYLVFSDGTDFYYASLTKAT